jgi:hypothetical protein
VGAQGHNIFKEIEEIVGPVATSRPVTRRERGAASSSTPRHPSRWLRRRYQKLLGRLPALIYTYDPKHPEKQGKYTVQLPINAIHSDLNPSANRRPLVDDLNLAWLKQADTLDQSKDKSKRSR